MNVHNLNPTGSPQGSQPIAWAILFLIVWLVICFVIYKGVGWSLALSESKGLGFWRGYSPAIFMTLTLYVIVWIISVNQKESFVDINWPGVVLCQFGIVGLAAYGGHGVAYDTSVQWVFSFESWWHGAWLRASFFTWVVLTAGHVIIVMLSYEANRHQVRRKLLKKIDDKFNNPD